MKTKLKFFIGIFALSIVSFIVYELYAWSHPDSEPDHLEIMSYDDTKPWPEEYWTIITYRVKDQYDEPIEYADWWPIESSCGSWIVEPDPSGSAGSELLDLETDQFGEFRNKLWVNCHPDAIPEDYYATRNETIYLSQTDEIGNYLQRFYSSYARVTAQ